MEYLTESIKYLRHKLDFFNYYLLNSMFKIEKHMFFFLKKKSLKNIFVFIWIWDICKQKAQAVETPNGAF